MKVENGHIVQLQHDGSNTMWYARAQLNLIEQKGYLITMNTAEKKSGRMAPKDRKNPSPKPQIITVAHPQIFA
ncbi:hypothetical protein N8582_00765 [Akkermansiaceae bacterium]|nr:hypothetical protein [Akkermansiaceae bacterium]